MDAIGVWLEKNKVPGRSVGEIDNRGSNYYLAQYWAQELAKVDAETFGELAKQLTDNEEQIVKDLIEC